MLCAGLRLLQGKGFVPLERHKGTASVQAAGTACDISHLSEVTQICSALGPSHLSQDSSTGSGLELPQSTDIPAYPEDFVHPHSGRTEDKSCEKQAKKFIPKKLKEGLICAEGKES